MAFDTFISYSSKDKTTANMACAALESAGIRCWIAPRDIRPGTEYAAAIVDGIDTCRILVLIFSANANASPQIHRELERAVSKGLTIIPFRIEDIAPSRAMEYYIGSIHWLDALTPPLTEHLGQLVEQIKANLNIGTSSSAAPVGIFGQAAAARASPGSHYEQSSRPPSQSIIGKAGQLALVAIVGILAAAVFLLGHFLPLSPSAPDRPAGAGLAVPPVTVPQPAPQPAPIPAPAFTIRKSAGFGGNGGSAFDEADLNADHLPISALSVGINLNPADTTQRIVGSVQVQWGDKIGPLHGGKGPLAQPGTTVRFESGEKIGRVDINSRAYHFPTSNAPPQWIAGLEIWTDTRVYTFGDMTFGPTNQCILDYGEILLGFFGRSGSYIDQIGCIIGKAK